MTANNIPGRSFESGRHKTAYLETGPPEGPLMIFLHGWPELGIVWREQLIYFGECGWRCIAPDMRGYGGSSVPDHTGAYAISEIVSDMTELHSSLGGAPAVWVGHDWGCPIVWSLASHHADRCHAIVTMCVPYFARGFALSILLPLVNRNPYPESRFPAGQWDYFLDYLENFNQAATDFENDIEALFSMFFRAGSPEVVGKPAITSNIRAQGGWFGEARAAPKVPRETRFMPEEDFYMLVEAFKRTGFRGANSWYINDAANLAFAADAPGFGTLALPVLFMHAAWDAVSDSVNSKFADPMRADCLDLTEVIIDAGHELQLEKPQEVNKAIDNWLKNKGLVLPPPAI